MHLLTGESPPASDIAWSTVGQDVATLWEAGGHYCVSEGDRGRQLDQGNVVTAKGETMHPYSGSDDKQNGVSDA